MLHSNNPDCRYRIAASAIIIHKDKILLVRAYDKQGKSFFLGPGGGVEHKETLTQALIREVREETGLLVQPDKMLLVEDLLIPRYRMIKFWFLCEIMSGQLQQQTSAAQEEGIAEVGWYSKNQLINETVYPALLKTTNWDDFTQHSWQTLYLDLIDAEDW